MQPIPKRHQSPYFNQTARKHNQLWLPGIARGADNPWPTRRLPTLRRTSKGECHYSTLELCAGAGGQALGFEQASFNHVALVEIEPNACATLRSNRPNWTVVEADIRSFRASGFKGVDVVAGGLPCPPFSVAGKQLGQQDERNLFPALFHILEDTRPRAVMIENVRGILDPIFDEYRTSIARKLKQFGYACGWKLMNACDFGVPQLRPRVAFVAVKKEYEEHFGWPEEGRFRPKTVGDTIYDLMISNGWTSADEWRKQANQIAPTIVGGSHKHGGPDLGPTRARKAWKALGVDGLGIADDAPSPTYSGLPRLTVRMVARLQGFPDRWSFSGGKTQAYRQVGNAFPPPFARAIARSLYSCLRSSQKRSSVAVPS
jgi:DNA (cytosine-5)-methyltransferase 1